MSNSQVFTSISGNTVSIRVVIDPADIILTGTDRWEVVISSKTDHGLGSTGSPDYPYYIDHFLGNGNITTNRTLIPDQYVAELALVGQGVVDFSKFEIAGTSYDCLSHKCTVRNDTQGLFSTLNLCLASGCETSPANHLECILNKCTIVDGAGTNTCSVVGSVCNKPTINYSGFAKIRDYNSCIEVGSCSASCIEFSSCTVSPTDAIGPISIMNQITTTIAGSYTIKNTYLIDNVNYNVQKTFNLTAGGTYWLCTPISTNYAPNTTYTHISAVFI